MSPADTALGPVARAGAGQGPRPRVSFEFSPPKGPKSEESLWEAIRRLEPLNPEFVSVTYGAGGSTRERTHRTVVRILKETSLRPAAHLTCVEASRGEVDEVIQDYWDAGIRHIVALRGDPPGSLGGAYTPRADGYQNATELTAGIRAIAPFDVSVGVYPQIHPESPSVDHDIDGYLRFVERIRKAGVDAPIIPGIMPVSSFEGLANMSSRIGVAIPAWLANHFEGLDADPETRKLLAASVAAETCARLQEEGFHDFHFYTLNRADLVYAICRVLGVRETPPAEPKEAAA